jgi:hypothetical protein
MPLIDVGIGAGVSGSNSEDDAGAGATGAAGDVGVESGCVTDGRTVGAAGSFENAGKVKSKRYSG